MIPYGKQHITKDDIKAVKDLTYGKFLREARRSLVMTQYSEPSEDVKKIQTQRTNIADPNVAMTLKLD